MENQENKPSTFPVRREHMKKGIFSLHFPGTPFCLDRHSRNEGKSVRFPKTKLGEFCTFCPAMVVPISLLWYLIWLALRSGKTREKSK
jgi:hypothetical protein